MQHELELLTLHIETLFVQNGAERLLYINEPERPEAPRFFLGRTKEGVICRFRNDVPDKIVGQLEEVAASEPDKREPDRLDEAPVYSEVYKDILRQNGPIQHVWSGPTYRFPSEVDAPSGVVELTETNVNLLEADLPEWKAGFASRQPCVAVIHENRAVSLCCSSRTSPRAAEAGLETAPTFRGQGYAAKVVSGWAAAVREQGRIPLYSTSWDNGASRAVARKLGLVTYAADLHIT